MKTGWTEIVINHTTIAVIPGINVWGMLIIARDVWKVTIIAMLVILTAIVKAVDLKV